MLCFFSSLFVLRISANIFRSLREYVYVFGIFATMRQKKSREIQYIQKAKAIYQSNGRSGAAHIFNIHKAIEAETAAAVTSASYTIHPEMNILEQMSGNLMLIFRI